MTSNLHQCVTLPLEIFMIKCGPSPGNPPLFWNGRWLILHRTVWGTVYHPIWPFSLALIMALKKKKWWFVLSGWLPDTSYQQSEFPYLITFLWVLASSTPTLPPSPPPLQGILPMVVWATLIAFFWFVLVIACKLLFRCISVPAPPRLT